MPARALALGEGRWLLLLVYAALVGYFMYLAYRISASLNRMAALVEQIRLDMTARKD